MKTKRIIAIILALVLSFGTSILSYAAPYYEDNDIMPCYNNIDSCRADITKNGRSLTLEGGVQTFKNCVVKIKLTAEKSLTGNDNTWTTYYSFPYVTISTGESRIATKTLNNVPSGYYYRTVAVIDIYINNALVESVTAESDSVRV